MHFFFGRFWNCFVADGFQFWTDLEGHCTCCTCDDTNVGEVRFAVQLGKTLELVFLVKWVRYQGARGFGWARWRRHRCSTSAVIWTASPRCSHRAGLSRDRKVTQDSPEYTSLTGRNGCLSDPFRKLSKVWGTALKSKWVGVSGEVGDVPRS